MRPINCVGCRHWRSLSGHVGVDCGCHYLLEEKHCRERDGDICLSISPGTPKKIREWPMPDIGLNPYDGFKISEEWKFWHGY